MKGPPAIPGSHSSKSGPPPPAPRNRDSFYKCSSKPLYTKSNGAICSKHSFLPVSAPRGRLYSQLRLALHSGPWSRGEEALGVGSWIQPLQPHALRVGNTWFPKEKQMLFKKFKWIQSQQRWQIPATLPICEMNAIAYKHEIDAVQGKFIITLDGRRAI